MAIDPKILGTTLAEIRKRRGLTQRAVAEHIGVAPNYVSMMEGGLRAPSTVVLNQLADVFGVPAELILFLGGDSQTAEGENPAFSRIIEATRKTAWAAIDAQVKEGR